MGAADTYIQGYTATMRDLARSQAEARLQSGQAWQQAIGQVGQIAANVPGQLADERRAKQQEAIWQANLDRFNQQRQEDQWLKDAMNSSVDPATGDIDERRLTENLALLGAAELAPRALQTVREGKEAAIRLQNAIQQGQLGEAQLYQLQSQALAPYAKALVEAEGDPAVLNAALSAISLQLGPQMAEALRQSVAENPAGVLPFAKSLIQAEKPEKPVVVGEGGMLVDPRTGKVIAENAKPEAAQTLDQQLAAALKAGDRARINEIIKLKAQEAAATRAPQAPPQPSFSRAEVTMPDGTTKLANYDAKTGKYTDVDTGAVLQGVMSGPTADMRNKEQARAFVSNSINAIKEFSDRVIQRIGPGQRVDALKRGAEAVFGNDPDFRVYQDARMALAGNLAVAQQGSRPSDADIKAIWLPMVPDPYRDTSVSAEMKWKLINTMSIPQKGGAKTPETPAGGRGGAPDPLGIRNKGGG